MKRFAVILLGVSLSYVAACDESNDVGTDYFEYSYIDTVLVGDTIQNNESYGVVHVYPMGCNHLERIEIQEHGDTLALAALYHFIESNGAPCAHGSGLATTPCILGFSATGNRYLSYRRSETILVVRPVYVEE